jgi:hypothetical protein
MTVKAVISNLLYGSRLALQSMHLLAHANYRRHKAVNTFEQTLITNGIPRDIAQELTRAYPNPIQELISLLRH